MRNACGNSYVFSFVFFLTLFIVFCFAVLRIGCTAIPSFYSVTTSVKTYAKFLADLH